MPAPSPVPHPVSYSPYAALQMEVGRIIAGPWGPIPSPDIFIWEFPGCLSQDPPSGLLLQFGRLEVAACGDRLCFPNFFY